MHSDRTDHKFESFGIITRMEERAPAGSEENCLQVPLFS